MPDRLLTGLNGALKLQILDSLKDFLEDWAGCIPHFNQVFSPYQRLCQRLPRKFLEFSQTEQIAIKAPSAAEAIYTKQFQVIGDIRLMQELPKGAFPHFAHLQKVRMGRH
jgi:hypothetical protein